MNKLNKIIKIFVLFIFVSKFEILNNNSIDKIKYNQYYINENTIFKFNNLIQEFQNKPINLREIKSKVNKILLINLKFKTNFNKLRTIYKIFQKIKNLKNDFVSKKKKLKKICFINYHEFLKSIIDFKSINNNNIKKIISYNNYFYLNSQIPLKSKYLNYFEYLKNIQTISSKIFIQTIKQNVKNIEKLIINRNVLFLLKHFEIDIYHSLILIRVNSFFKNKLFITNSFEIILNEVDVLKGFYNTISIILNRQSSNNVHKKRINEILNSHMLLLNYFYKDKNDLNIGKLGSIIFLKTQMNIKTIIDNKSENKASYSLKISLLSNSIFKDKYTNFLTPYELKNSIIDYIGNKPKLQKIKIKKLKKRFNLNNCALINSKCFLSFKKIYENNINNISDYKDLNLSLSIDFYNKIIIQIVKTCGIISSKNYNIYEQNFFNDSFIYYNNIVKELTKTTFGINFKNNCISKIKIPKLI